MPNINPRIRSLDDLLGVARKVENTAATEESLPSLEITKFKCFRQRSSVVSGDTPSGCMRATDLMTW